MHEQPEGYGHEPYPNQPQGQGPGGYPPQPPTYPGQPQPPYGQQPPYGAQQPPAGPGWGQPGDPMAPGGFGPGDPMAPGGWGPPPGPPRKSNSGPIVVVAIAAGVVLLGGGGAIAYALSGNDKPVHPVAASSAPMAPTTLPSAPTGLPTSFPSIPSFSPPAIPTPSGSSPLDESMFVQAGDCVKITGKSPHLRMLRAGCDSAPYKVLKRFSGTSDRTKCRGVSGYTTAFWATNKKYTFLSYVLCLKHQ